MPALLLALLLAAPVRAACFEADAADASRRLALAREQARLSKPFILPPKAGPVTSTLDVVVHGSCQPKAGAHDIRPLLMNFFMNTVEEGMAALKGWSPGLADRLERSVRGKRVHLACEEGPDTSALGTYQYYFLGFFTHHAITFRTIPGTCDRAARLLDSPEDAKLAAEQAMCIPGEKSVVFHEFLHFAGLEDRPDHNQLGKGVPVSKRQYDRVYACTALVFPSYRHPIADDEPKGARPMTADACRTCVGPESPEAARCDRFPG